MSKRTGKLIPRESKTPTQYKQALADRIKAARESLELSISEVAEKLSVLVGREIRPDTYRKWETINSIVQVDAILPLCDILDIHVYDLLERKRGNSGELNREKAVA